MAKLSRCKSGLRVTTRSVCSGFGMVSRSGCTRPGFVRRDDRGPMGLKGERITIRLSGDVASWVLIGRN